jgi:hypothetical protein
MSRTRTRIPPTGRPRAAELAPAGPRLRAWPAATGLLTAFVLGVAVAFAIGALATRPDAAERQIANLKEADAKRDIAQITSLTELARGTRDRLTPVLVGMADAAPIGKTTIPGQVPSPEVVRGWRDVLSAEVTQHADAPSAGTAVNVARNGLRAAVQQLAAAVDGFDAALGASEPTKGRLLALAGQQRTLALRTWSVAAIQLDVINIDAGNGHAHVVLPAGPDSGVIAPDSSPEGTGRR